MGMPRSRKAVARWIQAHEIEAFVSFKVSLAVAIGTLLSLTPGYAALFNDPFALSSQVIFTILGGANVCFNCDSSELMLQLTVGDCCRQLFWRYVVGASAGAAGYAIIGLAGGSPAGQGVVFAVVVLAMTLFRLRVPKSDIGLTFATLACVYAVDASYQTTPPRYNVDGAALSDLMKSWAFGAAISVAVNFVILPVKASDLSRKYTRRYLRSTRSIVAWTFADSDAEYTPADIRHQLLNEGDTLSTLHGELAWELSWSASDLTQRRALLDAVLELQRTLIVVARDGRFVTDLTPDLAAVVQPPTRLFTAWALETLDHIVTDIKRADVEKDAAARTTFVHVKIELDKAASQVTDIVVSSLSPPMPPVERLYELDRATHCINAVSRVAVAIDELKSMVDAERLRPKRFHSFISATLAATLREFSRAIRPSRSAARSDASSVSLPSLSVYERLIGLLATSEVKSALKITAALCCLLSLLWSPGSRQFWNDYAIRTATVPLLLALMPNSGLSVLSWIGQLSGAIAGIFAGALIMVIWRGVGKSAYCVPGIFFFQLILSMTVAGRLRHGPDFFAVTALLLCAIFINVQVQMVGKGFEQSIGLHTGNALVSICIAIALAVPFQLLIFPQHARDALRSSVADSLYRLSKIALDQVDLSSRAFWSDDVAALEADQRRLADELGDLERSVRDQDGLVAFAAAEFTSRERFDATRARAVVEALHRVLAPMADHVDLCAAGPVDPRVRGMLSPDGAQVAATLAQHSSTVFWTLSASYSLGRSPPGGIPAVETAARALLASLEQRTLQPWIAESIDTRADVRRWWSLTMTLVTQHREITRLLEILRPEWQQRITPTEPHDDTDKFAEDHVALPTL